MNISGYTWGFNAVKKLLPYEACIKSMLLLADEVFVAYDPRYDSPEHFTRIDDRVTAVPQELDVSNIKNEGNMLNSVRQRCSGEWLAWFDLDEILHEKDINNILNLMRYAEGHGHNSLELGFYSYIAKKYTFPRPESWGIRPKIMRNIEGVSHGMDPDWLQQREDGTHYLLAGDGIDFIKDGKVFAHTPLVYKDLPLFQRLKDGTATGEDIIKSTEFFPYIYHYARYSMQRKGKMLEGDRFSYWQGHHNNFNPVQWIQDLSAPILMENQKEIPVAGSIGDVEPSHSQHIMEWVNAMDGFMI